MSTSVWLWANPADRAASIRSALARLDAFTCSPFQRVAWWLLHAVATTASASSTVETISTQFRCVTSAPVGAMSYTGTPDASHGNTRS